jgi:tetratricopeptide (TPR) repeat protein
VKLALCLFAVAVRATAADQSIATLLEHNHFRRARALIKLGDAESYSQQSRVEWAFNNESAAIAQAERAIAMDPRSADYHFYFAQILGEAAGRANMFRALGLARRCRKEIDAALALKPDHSFALFAKMLFLYEAPGIAGGDKAQAFATATEIERVEPARGNFGRARLAAHDKKTAAQAEGYYLKAIAINPRYYSALVELANFYRTATPPRYDLAEKYARDAQKVEPDRVGAYVVLAESYAATGRMGELEVVLRESEENVGDDLAGYYRAAVILAGPDPERAKKYLRKYLSQEPEAREPGLAEARQALGRIR